MRRTIRAGLAVVLVVAVVIGLFWAFQRQLVYLPGGAPTTSAAEVGADAVTLRTDDDVELTAWWFPADPAVPRRDAAVLVTPGNAGSRESRVPLARALVAEGLDVLVLEYRGFGGNPGAPSEEGLAADARAAYDHVVGERGVDPGRVVVFGESLGAGVAVRLAMERDPAAVVLRSPFTSLADVGARVYPWLPVRLLLRDRYPSIDLIGSVAAPVTVLAGTADEIVPVEQSRELAAATGTSAIEVSGARHNDPELVGGPVVVEAVLAAVP